MTTNLGDIFGLMPMSAIMPTKIKTYEDDPTLFGETLCRRVSIPNDDLEPVDVRKLLPKMRDNLKSDIGKFAPRCQDCINCVANVEREEDFVADVTLFTVSATCAKEGGYSMVCPDGQTAVRKGHRAVVDACPGMTDDLPDAQPNITLTSPDKPTTLAHDAW